MSIVFLITFIFVALGKIELPPENFGITWALFAIADALWFRKFN